MSDFIADLGSPRWWMSVVLAGIVVNIAASYLGKLLDARLTRASTWWRQRKASVERQRQATLGVLRANPDRRALLEAAEIRSRLRSLVFLVQATGMAVLIVLFVTFGVPKWFATAAISCSPSCGTPMSSNPGRPTVLQA
jgi:hypothetical protein